MDRGIEFLDLSLRVGLVGLDVLLSGVDAFDDDLLGLGHGLEDLALGAFVLAADDDDHIACLDFHDSVPPWLREPRPPERRSS